MTELRRIIEPGCAYLAAQRANKDQILEIEKALNDMESAAGKTEATVEADLRFHLAILDATHNSFMRPFGSLIQAGLTASFRLTNADKEAYRRSLVKHRTVYTAIQSGSAQQAEEAMHAVLRGSHRDIERSLDGKKRKTLGVAIGKPAKYVSEADALAHVAGYCVINDVSERAFQLEGTGQWTKGKSADTFPVGFERLSGEHDFVVRSADCRSRLHEDNGFLRDRHSCFSCVIGVVEADADELPDLSDACADPVLICHKWQIFQVQVPKKFDRRREESVLRYIGDDSTQIAYLVVLVKNSGAFIP